MNATDWIIGTSAAVVSLVITIAGYFMQKWISNIEETIKEHSSDLKALSKQISTFKQEKDTQTESLSKTIRTQFTALQLPRFEQLEEIKRDVETIKATMSGKILPQLARQQESLGKIIVIESALNEQGRKMIGLYEVTKILVEKTQKGPK